MKTKCWCAYMIALYNAGKDPVMISMPSHSQFGADSLETTHDSPSVFTDTEADQLTEF